MRVVPSCLLGPRVTRFLHSHASHSSTRWRLCIVVSTLTGNVLQSTTPLTKNDEWFTLLQKTDLTPSSHIRSSAPSKTSRERYRRLIGAVRA